MLSLVVTAISVLIPRMSQTLVDKGLIGMSPEITTKLSIIIVAVCILQNTVLAVQSWIHVGIENDIYDRLSKQCVIKMAKLKMMYFETNENLEKIVATNGYIHNISGIASEQFLGVLAQLVKLAGGVVGLLYINPLLSIFILIIAGIRYYLMNRTKSDREKLYDECRKINNEYSVWFTDFINGIRTIKLWNIPKDKERNDILDRQISNQKKIYRVDIIEKLLSDALYPILTYGLYLLGFIFITKGQLTIGGLFAYIMYADLVISPVFYLIMLHSKILSLKPAIEGYNEFLDLDCELSGLVSSAVEQVNEIIFDNVTWECGSKKILSNVSLEIKIGEKIGIVGLNGSGKSSLLDILLRLKEPTSGHVLLNGTNISQYEIESYRRLFSVIDQNTFLFDGTVKDNLFLDKKAPPEAKSLEIMNWFIDNVLHLKYGLNTQTGQKGMLLSGGEKQKIALLRSALKQNSHVLILDEATASYDLESERIVNEFLIENENYDILIMVTHRPDILSSLDKVIIIEDGHVISIGSYESQKKQYADFFNYNKEAVL
ncbi:MAG: ABC transporter ATP-binding protein [Clostridia bacterium]